MATKPLELSSLEGLRGGRDSGAIVVFVFGLGSPSRSLPGRQHSPAKRALQATRGAHGQFTRGHEVNLSSINGSVTKWTSHCTVSTVYLTASVLALQPVDILQTSESPRTQPHENHKSGTKQPPC
jgi:hypothetical protein